MKCTVMLQDGNLENTVKPCFNIELGGTKNNKTSRNPKCQVIEGKMNTTCNLFEIKVAAIT